MNKFGELIYFELYLRKFKNRFYWTPGGGRKGHIKWGLSVLPSVLPSFLPSVRLSVCPGVLLELCHYFFLNFDMVLESHV